MYSLDLCREELAHVGTEISQAFMHVLAMQTSCASYLEQLA